jgi:hypothetical protein
MDDETRRIVEEIKRGSAYKNQVGSEVGQQITGNPNWRYEDAVGQQTIDQSIKEAAFQSLGAIADGLDYLGNISRTAINAAATDQDVWEQTKKAASYEVRTPSSRLRENLNKLGGPLSPLTHKYGVDDNQFQIEDIADFASDVALDIVTDPMTLFSLGANTAIKKAATGAAEIAGKKITKEMGERLATRVSIETGKDITPEMVGAARKTDDEIREAALKRNAIDEEWIARKNEEVFGAEKRAGDVYRELYGATAGGTYTAGATLDSDSTPEDMAAAFLAGAVGTATVRKYGSKLVKPVAANLGKAINNSFFRNKKVPMKAVNNVGPEPKPTSIEVDTPGYVMADEVARAGDVVRVTTGQINQVGQLALKRMRKNDVVGAATALDIASNVRDTYVRERAAYVADMIKRTPDDKLKQLGLNKDTTYANIPAGHILKEQADAIAKQKLFDPRTGRPRREFLADYMRKTEIKLTPKVFENYDIWNKASQKMWEITKAAKLENLRKTPELERLIGDRAAAMKDRSGYKVELLSEQDLADSFKMVSKMEGMPSWVPRIGEKGFTTTKLASDAKPKVPLTAKQKRAMSDIERMKRDYVGKDSIPQVKQGQIMNADEVVDNFEKAMYISAHNQGKGTLNIIQKEAVNFMGDIRSQMSPALRTLKKFNATVKKGLLLGGYTWAVNNYWSNMRQAYVNSGLMGTVDGLRLFDSTNASIKDIKKIFLHKGDDTPIFKYASKDTEEMLRLGVIEDTHMSAIKNMADADKKFLYDQQTIDKIAKAEADMGMLERGLTKVSDFMDDVSRGTALAPEFTKKMNKITGELEGGFGLPHYTRQVGSYIEAVFRAQTYLRQRDILRKQYGETLAKTFGEKAARESINKEALKITNEVFFDYGKLNYFEKSFVREVIPFYSFYKQNFMYQAASLFQAGRSVRQNVMAKVGRGEYFGGTPLTEQQREAMPDYLQDKNGYYYYDKDGSMKVVFSTSDPSQAFYEQLSTEYWSKNLVNQLNPALKSVFENLSGYDIFRGESLDPKDLSNRAENQKKYLFARGHAMGKVYNLVAAALQQDRAVITDQKGNPITDEEWVARVDNIMSWAGSMFTSVPVKLYGEYSKVREGKQDWNQAVMNTYGPAKETTLTRLQQQRALQKSLEEKEREAMEETRKRIFQSLAK